MVRQAGAFVLVLLFGLASCTVGPDYVRPTAPMQETFKEMDGWKQAEPREDLLRGKWWEIFTNSELSALQDQVDITNQNIATAAANFRQAVALVAVARASYFPTASISPAATRLYRSTGTASASASAASQHDRRGRQRLFPSGYRLVGARRLGPRAAQCRVEPRKRPGERRSP